MTFPLKYLLDTNACIVYIRNLHSGVRRKLESLPKSEIAICSIVKAEMFYGSMKSENPQKSLMIQQKFFNQFHSLPFDDEAALIFGEIRADLAKKERLSEHMICRLPQLLWQIN